jgi:hypothetical protein
MRLDRLNDPPRWRADRFDGEISPVRAIALNAVSENPK